MWGVTIVGTLAQSYVAGTSQSAGAAEARKQRKYEALQNRFIVQPVGFESTGSWSAREVVSDGHRKSSDAGDWKSASHGIPAPKGKY